MVDGFHRCRVGKECEDIRARVHGYLPVVRINERQEDRGDRIAATIRHNRARGKHKVDAMSDIVIELKRRNWSDKRSKQLGMTQTRYCVSRRSRVWQRCLQTESLARLGTLAPWMNQSCQK